MGEMTIRLDEATLVALRARAHRPGIDVESVASDILQAGLSVPAGDKAATAKAIQSRTVRSPISSIYLLDEIRDEGR